jgi:hypothetical protein
MNEFLVNPVFMGVVGTAVGGVVAGVVGYFSKRVEKAPDMQASLDKAIAGVVDHYVKALAGSHDEMREMRSEIRAMRETIADLEEHIDSLTAALEKAGVAPPPRRKRTAAT